MKWSSCLKLLLVGLLFVLAIFIFLPTINYCLLEPNLYSENSHILIITKEVIFIDNHLCLKTVEGYVVRPPSVYPNWYGPYLDFSQYPFVSQAVYVQPTTPGSGCWVSLEDISPYCSENPTCSTRESLIACWPVR